MAPEHFAAPAAIQADDVIVLDRPPDRYRRSEFHVLLFGWLAELAQCLVNSGNNVRKLIRS